MQTEEFFAICKSTCHYSESFGVARGKNFIHKPGGVTAAIYQEGEKWVWERTDVQDLNIFDTEQECLYSFLDHNIADLTEIGFPPYAMLSYKNEVVGFVMLMPNVNFLYKAYYGFHGACEFSATNLHHAHAKACAMFDDDRIALDLILHYIDRKNVI